MTLEATMPWLQPPTEYCSGVVRYMHTIRYDCDCGTLQTVGCTLKTHRLLGVGQLISQQSLSQVDMLIEYLCSIANYN